MKKYNFSKYFDLEDIKYYEPKIIITILEDILGKDLNTIKSDIEELKSKQKAVNEYLLGRFYHNKKQYKTALEYYKKSKEMGNDNMKNKIAAILAKLHICI